MGNSNLATIIIVLDLVREARPVRVLLGLDIRQLPLGTTHRLARLQRRAQVRIGVVLVKVCRRQPAAAPRNELAALVVVINGNGSAF